MAHRSLQLGGAHHEAGGPGHRDGRLGNAVILKGSLQDWVSSDSGEEAFELFLNHRATPLEFRHSWQ
jgi:hypothetical protein